MATQWTPPALGPQIDPGYFAPGLQTEVSSGVPRSIGPDMAQMFDAKTLTQQMFAWGKDPANRGPNGEPPTREQWVAKWGPQGGTLWDWGMKQRAAGIDVTQDPNAFANQVANVWQGAMSNPQAPSSGSYAGASGASVPGDYNITNPANNPFAIGDTGSYIDPGLRDYWSNVMGKDIYGNPTFGAKTTEFNQGLASAGVTGQYNGQDTLAMLQQKMNNLKTQADIAKMQGDSVRADQYQALLQQTQDQANTIAMMNQKMNDLKTQADIAKMQGDSVRADEYQRLLQQTQDQANEIAKGNLAISGRSQTLAETTQLGALTGYIPGTGVEGQPGTGQLTAEQRTFYITNYGYDPGATGAGIQSGGAGTANQTIGGRAQTLAEQNAERDWQFKQAQMAANPENAATMAAFYGRAPWQQGMAQGTQQGQGQGQSQSAGWQAAMASGGQPGLAEQNSPDWQRAGMANPRQMGLQSYDTMSPSQKAAFGSYAKAAGGSAGDYEAQLNTYRPQKTQAAQGDYTG